MSASQSAVRSRAEAVKVSRTLDYMILFVLFFIMVFLKISSFRVSFA